jgi:hypothetical protein
MVKLTKRPLPEGITINSPQDYRTGEVLNILVEDCHRKCYICEDKPTSINVEHIIPHRNDLDIKYCWDNLFIACGHCNNLKGTKYDNIINPVLSDPEENIALSIEISEDFIESVGICPLNNDSITLNTVALLELVYNGGSTNIKEIECANLRNEHLVPDIQHFIQYIHDYISEPELGYDTLIRREINRSSKFSAFKRKIILDHPKLSKIFKDALI